MILKLLFFLFYFNLFDARVVNICEELGLENIVSYTIEKNDNNFVCFNTSDKTVFTLNILPNSKILLYPQSIRENFDRTQICERSPERGWRCQSIVFIVPNNDLLERQLQQNRVKRQSGGGGVDLIQPVLPIKNVTFSTMTVAGVEWVCEQLSETQCKPLYPQQQQNKDESQDKQKVSSPSQQKNVAGRNSGEPRAQYFTDDTVNSNVGVVNDDNRWRWSQGQARSKARKINDQNDDVFRAFQQDLNRNNDNSTGQYVYNINGITWLCRQFAQLQCYPIMNPWDGSTPPPGLSTATPPHVHPGGGVDPGYPEYPSSEGEARALQGEDVTWEYQGLNNRQTTQKPAFKKTTFCSRSVKFIAKDEAVLSFNTYSGIMKMYINAARKNRGVEVSSRMLRTGEDGLGGQDNSPPVVINANVNCDTITLVVEGSTYKLDYGFGRLGVKDLEVLGNLESTGMVPRDQKEKARLGSVRNFIEPGDRSPIQLRPSPIDDSVNDDNYVDVTTVDNEDDLDIPVTEDSYQIEGQGDVEVSLGEKSNTQHRYQISRGQDGEVNIDVVVGDRVDTGTNDNRNIVIDNKDYNYTLIISGQNIQVIHHDTNRNLTYRHGIDQNQISGVGVQGDLRGTSTSFKQPEDAVTESPRSFPQSTKPSKTVSIYGNLCVGACEMSTDKRHYCAVYGGATEQCGPLPSTTSMGDPCSDECRKRNDDYFWCQRSDAPWDYCSPPLVFQQHLTCPPDSERMTVADPSSCARFLSCEAGNVKLEECPDGLHYIHKNRTCEWPINDGQCGDVFSRSGASSPSTSSPPPSSTSTTARDQSVLTLARTDPIFRIPDEYFDDDYNDYSGGSNNKRIRFPSNIEPRVNPKNDITSNVNPTNIPPSLTSLFTSTLKTETNPRSLFQDGSFGNSIDNGRNTPRLSPPSTPLITTPSTTVSPQTDEMDLAELIERSKDFKYGLTSHGELCTDKCEKRGYPYYWCHKPTSSLGQWWDSDFCSPSTSVTHYGKECEDSCEQRGEKYFWCRRKVDGGWGYCSPRTVFTHDSCDRDDTQFYAIVGDCDRYIQCRGNRPVVTSCDGLHFDYILRSCTFPKDARCIGHNNEN